MATVKSISLNFENEKSDKFYNVEINEGSGASDSYTVDFHYGRNGTDGQHGTKTKEPVTLEKAEKIFNGLVKKKMDKGYEEV